MSQIDLSSLSGPELRGLLDSARQRGQAAQSYEILKEMAERRERREARVAGRPAARTISLDLGDPLERDDPLELGAPPAAASAAAPEPDGDFDLDLTFTREQRAPRAKPRRAREPRWDDPPEPPPKKPRKPRWPLAVFVGGVAVGGALGVGFAREQLMEASVPKVAVFPAAPLLRPDQVPAPAVPPVEPAAPVTMAQAEPPPADAVAPELAPAEPPPAAEAAPAAATEVAAAEPPPEAPVEETAPAPEPARACHGATPADRAICGDPGLQRLQKALQQAYADALAAHQDRATLRERQLAWRDARNEVADPERLARMYEARIRKLNAAAAEARRER
jgi:uncharacterized protein YecT (DUF1311 family)